MANSAGAGGKSAARVKKLNETKMILRQPILLAAVVLTILLLLLFVIYPLIKILIFSLTDAEGKGVLQHLLEGADYTLYGLANAVTRYSQDVESYDRASKLEEIGLPGFIKTRRGMGYQL